MEDIFADLEMEMEQRELYSGIGPNQSGMTQQVPRSATEPPHGHPPPPYQPPHQEIQPFPQGHHAQGLDPSLGHFDANAAPGFPQFGQDRDNFRSGVRNQQTPHGAGPQYGFDAEHDFPKRTDLDLASDLPRERRRAPSPRTDPMKQQQKWQEDEKLGDTATISPVLYANLEHVNLQKEYPGMTSFIITELCYKQQYFDSFYFSSWFWENSHSSTKTYLTISKILVAAVIEW